jgi:flagellar basal body-associated protein FliL
VVILVVYMKKRGQGHMWWIIVALVVVLVVGGILIYLFSSKISIFKTQTESCIFKGGVCKEQCDPGESEVRNTDCSDDKPRCCVGVLG